MAMYKVGNLEMYADGGSIVVNHTTKGITKRISVPDWKERIEAVAISRLNKMGSEYSRERDLYHEGVKLAQAMQSVLKEAEEQGDVTNQRVINHLYQELTMNPKYTMKPKVIYK